MQYMKYTRPELSLVCLYVHMCILGINVITMVSGVVDGFININEINGETVTPFQVFKLCHSIGPR